MRSFQELLLLVSAASLALAQTPSASCPAYSCTGGAQASIASSLNGYAAASSLCSSSYVPVQTCRATAALSTVRTTIATVTTQSIVQTRFTTITGTTRTFTRTASVTPTTTVTVSTRITLGTTRTSTVIVTETTVANPNKKRQVTRGGLPVINRPTTTTSIDRQSSLLSSLRATQSSAYIAAVCTCLVTPASTTIISTPVVTSRVTATVTQRVAILARRIVYPSTTITVTSTAAPVTRTISTAVTSAFTSVTLTTTTEIATATATIINGCELSSTPGEEFEGMCGPGAGTAEGACACFRDTSESGRGFCALYDGECGTPCVENSDCEVGSYCLVDGSGFCGGSSCANPADVSACFTSGSQPNKRSSNPMAFKAMAKRAKHRNYGPSGRRPGIDIDVE